MANPSSPSRAPRSAPQRKVHRYVDALFTDDFGRQSTLTITSANSFAKKKLGSASQSLQLKSERQEKQARRVEIREWRAAERSVAAELRESDHRIRAMWRSLKTKVRPEKKIRHTPPRERTRHWPYASTALPKYDGPVIDRSGERAVFARMRYYSRKTAEQGVSKRVIAYCFNGAALDPDGNPYVATNVGLTIDEALCGFDHLEQINWSAQSNAKLLMHGILAVDHRQTPDEMMTCGLRWAEETLGRFDLPYLVTLHAPPPDGDQRNWHLHILWSYRPLVRTGDHEWDVAEMLRSDLDNPAAMKVFREMFASVMTEMSFEAGQNQIWTAKSNAARGLPHEPQVHLGAAKTNQARSGEHVAENEENHERVMRSKAAVIDDALRHADETLAALQAVVRAIAARFARVPALPMRVPERIVAATMALEAPAFGAAPRRSVVSIVVAAVPQIKIEPARIVGSIEGLKENIPQLSSVEIGACEPPRSEARASRMEIANLRIRSLPLAKPIIAHSGNVPVVPPRASAPALSLLPMMPTLRLAEVGYQTIVPPIVARPAIPQVQAVLLFSARLTLADTDLLDRVLARVKDVRKRDDERRKREDEAIARIAQEARAVAAQQAAIQRQLIETSATVAERKSAWRLARAKRERATAKWAEIERLEGARRTQRGRAVELPGNSKDVTEPTIQRRFPTLPGRGIGD